MRRNICAFAAALSALTLLFPVAARAKGSSLHFSDGRHAPGELAAAEATVETWKGSGNEPGGGPYAVYLVRGKQPLWFGHLPRFAIRVGRLHIGDLTSDAHGTGQTYRVTVAFKVPRVPEGRYAVWVCRAGCGARTGFGDLVYGRLGVTRELRSSPTAAPSERAAPPLTRDPPGTRLPMARHRHFEPCGGGARSRAPGETP